MISITLSIASFILASTFALGADQGTGVPPPAPPAPATTSIDNDVPPPAPPSDQISIAD